MSQLTKHRCAKIIQKFYKRFIKNVNRIDPIDHDIIPANKRLKVIITNDDKITGVRYFNIDNLDIWFVTRGEPINPVTNLNFTEKQIIDIRKYYKKCNKELPIFLKELPSPIIATIDIIYNNYIYNIIHDNVYDNYNYYINNIININ